MPATPDPSLGGVLLEQKIRKGQIGNFVFLTIVALPFVLVPAVPAAPLEVKLGMGLFGLGLIAFVAIMAWRYWMHVFLQEQGICEYRQGKPRSLRYDQVATLHYTSLRIFSHGSYVHTVQKVAIQADEPESKPLVCTHIFREADGRAPAETRTPLTLVRDQVTPRLADRLHAQLRRGQAVPWSDTVQVGLDGLIVAEGAGREEQIAWSRVSRIAIDEGVCQISIDGESAPRWKLKSAEPNFWAVLNLVERLRRERAR